MKHSLFKILLYTQLLVLVNWIQGCGGNNIDLKESTSIAPAGEATPANNPTPNSEEKTATPNPQESDAYSTASERLNNTASGTTRNGGVAPTEVTTNFQVDNTTHNSAEKTATSNAKESSASSTTSSITSATSTSQESNEYTHPIDTVQQQEIKTIIIDNLPSDVLTNIDNYLKEGHQGTAISSWQHAIELLEEGNMSNSLLKIFEGAISEGAENYVKGFYGSNDYHKVQDHINKQLEKIKNFINPIK